MLFSIIFSEPSEFLSLFSYRLPLLSHLPNGKTPLDKSSCQRGGSEPLLQDAENTSLPEGSVVSYYSRKFSTSELRSKVTVALPPNGGRIEIRSKNRYDVLGRDGEIRRTLEIDRRGRVFEILDGDSDDDCSSVEDDKSNTIRLGLVSLDYSLLANATFSVTNAFCLHSSFHSIPETIRNEIFPG